MLTRKRVKQAIRDKFAWPGGYTIVLLANDGHPICTDCGRSEWKNICSSMMLGIADGWKIESIFLLEGEKEYEGDCICAHCNKDIWTM